ncbi:MAG: YIP1 family protein [Limisphaerales bacterium]
MIKALLLIFDSAATWERIALAQRRAGFIFLFFLLPLLGFTSAVEGYGLVHWGKDRGEVLKLRRFPVSEAAVFEAAQIVLWLLIILISTKVIKSMCETFHGQRSYTPAFATVAYGLSPLFLLHLLDAFPAVSPWTSWAVGIILSIAVLYQGVPRMMEPDPPHAFGLYLMSALTVLLATGLLRFVTAWYLQGKFGKLEDLLSLSTGS